MTTQRKTCSTCDYWWQREGQPVGTCHIDYPRVDGGRQRGAFWPLTYEVDGCSHHYNQEQDVRIGRYDEIFETEHADTSAKMADPNEITWAEATTQEQPSGSKPSEDATKE